MPMINGRSSANTRRPQRQTRAAAWPEIAVGDSEFSTRVSVALAPLMIGKLVAIVMGCILGIHERACRKPMRAEQLRDRSNGGPPLLHLPNDCARQPLADRARQIMTHAGNKFGRGPSNLACQVAPVRDWNQWIVFAVNDMHRQSKACQQLRAIGRGSDGQQLAYRALLPHAALDATAQMSLELRSWRRPRRTADDAKNM